MHRRLLGCALALFMVLFMSASSAGAANPQAKGLQLKAKPLKLLSSGSGAKSLSGRMAQSDRALLKRTDSKVIPVMVKLDYDAVASYRGTIKGLAATSPSVTGRSLQTTSGAVRAYRDYVARLEGSALSAIRAQVPQARLLQTFRIAYGGVSMMIPANRAKDLLGIPGVAAVQANKLQQTLANDKSVHFIRADKTWPDLGGRDHAGEGVVIGVLDTGIWPEHPALEDRVSDPRPGETFGCEFGDGTDPDLGDPFTCDDKMLGAYAFTDTYQAVIGAGADEFCNATTLECSARDSEGHGTHTLTTAAGDHLGTADVFGVDRGPFDGVAPGASTIAYRVCLAQGCFSDDSVAAVGQAILDGVDVINFSISGGADAYTDPVELAFLDAFNADITVNASGGNDGPGAGTVNHNSPWVTTVAASSWDGQYKGRVELDSTEGDTLGLNGASITAGLATPAPVVEAADVAGYNDALCATPLPAGSVTGDIVACERGGGIARVEKGFNAMEGGAVGMILYNPTPQDVETDNHWIPTVHLDGDKGDDLLAFLDTHTGVTATFDSPALKDAEGDVLAAFSSKGPGTDWIKPDITAPGIQILAGHTPEPADILAGPPGELFQAIAGTSMSSPHSAGQSILIKAAHPGWSPSQIKSASMLTATTKVVKEDTTTKADPFDVGAGRIRANKAVNSPLTLKESGADFAASEGDPLHRIDLNIASVNAPDMPGSITTTRKVKNTTGKKTEFKVKTSSTDGEISVSPKNFTLKKNKSKTIEITIDGEDMSVGDQGFGSIKLNPDRSGFVTAKMPVAFVRTEGTVTLSHTCSPHKIDKGDVTNCEVTATNNSPIEAPSTLKVSSSDPDGLKVKNWSRGKKTKRGFKAKKNLGPAAAPTVDSITAGGAGFGYVSMESLGVPAIPGMGDETFANLGVPTFEYGSESYNEIFMDANGYGVPGFADGNSNVCCDMPPIPNPALPNNTLAPYWTDLNPDPAEVGPAGGMYAAVVTAGPDEWIVLDWHNVPIFGTSDFQNFEIWIQTIGSQAEPVTFEYGTVSGAEASTGAEFGAENRDGTSGASVPAPPPATGDAYTVNTSPPAPGGTLTVTYDGKGLKKGRYDLRAELHAPDVQTGDTVNTKHIRVTL